MPPEAPVPITPEGKRATEKVRTIFACIVAANLALIGIVIWHNYPGKGDDARAKDAVSAMEKTIEQSVAAYNSGDARAFSALFATTAHSKEAGSNPALRLEEYHREFGRVLAKKPVSKPEAQGGDRIALIVEISCEKVPAARLAAVVLREKGGMKLVEWRIEQR
jgi:hypothetical protein